MSDRPPLDEDLMRLFEGARSELPSEVFVQGLERRLAKARGTRLGIQIALLALLAVAAAFVAPYVTVGSLTAMDHAVQWVPEVGLALSSPAGWVVSLMLGAWVLKRAHVFER